MKTKRPRLLLCDLGDTLVTWTGYDRERGLTSLRGYCDRPNRFNLTTLVERGVALDRDLEERAAASLLEFRQADFLRTVFASIGIVLEIDDDELEALYWRSALEFVPEPGVEASLDRIAGTGVRLGVISNTIFGPRAVGEELERHDIAHHFGRPILTSARYGVRKPHPTIFHAALGVFDTEASEAWYIGNSAYHDVGGANAAGLTAVWYNRKNGEAKTLSEPAAADSQHEGTPLGAGAARSSHPAPDVEVASWSALAGLIESLS